MEGIDLPRGPDQHSVDVDRASGRQISPALNSGTEATHTTDGLSYLGDASISTDASRNWPTGELLYWCVILSDYIQLRKTNGDCGD